MTILDEAIFEMARLAEGVDKNKATYAVSPEVMTAFENRCGKGDLSFLSIPIRKGRVKFVILREKAL